jgi:hypothetical protein
MPSKYNQQDLSSVKPISIEDRVSKVSLSDIVDPTIAGVSTSSALPDVLKGSDVKRVAEAITRARNDGRAIVWLVGAHVIKCGLSLYLRDLMSQGYISALATTGSSTVHDLELAFCGKTSEDVAVELPAGRFGMVAETVEHFNAACKLASEEELGLGEGIGRYIGDAQATNAAVSVYAGAYAADVPATVHVALGTDITHQHPSFSGAVVGDLSMRDFRILTHVIGRLFDNGVVVVFGSAVVLPEVFMKAVSINYNLGKKPRGVTAANFDMIQHYRVRENVLVRPFASAGQSFSITGHHEIMLPLLYQLVTQG